MKLSPTQKRALGKLRGRRQTAYYIHESMSTLQSLVRRGLAQSDYPTEIGLSSMYVSFWLTEAGEKEKP